MKVMRCLELANGQPGPAGQYLHEYDPRTGFSVWTRHKEKAKKFLDAPEAFELWRSVLEKEPVRAHDGKPNRPLTAFTITVEDE
jgi:hypothetical protein